MVDLAKRQITSVPSPVPRWTSRRRERYHPARGGHGIRNGRSRDDLLAEGDERQRDVGKLEHSAVVLDRGGDCVEEEFLRARLEHGVVGMGTEQSEVLARR